MWALLIYSASAIISQTTNYALSLAGVTGIIVAVGITVDSYVVYFERLKEEVRHGRTVRNSALRSFKATWRTIVAADLVSLIAAGVLFSLSVGSVRGFALYLGVTTVCDLIVCWFFTRPAVLLLADTGWLDEGDTFGLENYESRPLPAPVAPAVAGHSRRVPMTFVDDSGQGGEPPFGDLDLGVAEPPRPTVADGAPEPEPLVEQRIAKRPAKRLFLGQTAIDFWGHRRTYFADLPAAHRRQRDVAGDRERQPRHRLRGRRGLRRARRRALRVATPAIVLEAHGIDGNDAKVEERESTQGDIVKVQIEEVPADVRVSLQEAFADAAGVDAADVSVAAVSSSWGEQITRKAVIALLVFLLLFSIVIAIRFEWRMAVAAIVAMLHDVVIAAGIYSVFGFEVTPPTVIAFLTILGYSLYDTIVVFDRVKENERRIAAAGLGAADLVNVSTNQVLMRSLNTSLSALLPVFSLLVVGAWLLGQVTLLRVRPGPAHRHAHRGVLVDLRRHAGARRAQGRPARRRAPRRRGPAHASSCAASASSLRRPAAAGGRAAAVPATGRSPVAELGHSGVEPSAEQLLGNAPRPRKKKRH